MAHGPLVFGVLKSQRRYVLECESVVISNINCLLFFHKKE